MKSSSLIILAGRRLAVAVYKQIMVGVFERAFEINPTYRAEPSATTRHMTEFIHIDAEMGFVGLQDIMDLLSGLLNSVSEHI